MLNKNKININLNDKYFCYILGIIWADGFVCKKTNRVSISLIEEDILNIEYIFFKVGIWNKTFFNNKKRNYKNQIRLDVSDKNFHKFLVDNDFYNKSFMSPTSILSLIKKDNLKYFIRGLIDGDGCFYYNKKNYTRQLVISSTYEQNWDYMESFFNEIQCKYEIRQISNVSSKSSLIRITNIDIIKFGDIIYNDFFGLKRKYEKFLTIKESYLEDPYKDRKVRSKKIIIDNKIFNSLKEASLYFNIHRGTLRRKLKNGSLVSNYNECKMT